MKFTPKKFYPRFPIVEVGDFVLAPDGCPLIVEESWGDGGGRSRNVHFGRVIGRVQASTVNELYKLGLMQGAHLTDKGLKTLRHAMNIPAVRAMIRDGEQYEYRICVILRLLPLLYALNGET